MGNIYQVENWERELCVHCIRTQLLAQCLPNVLAGQRFNDPSESVAASARIVVFRAGWDRGTRQIETLWQKKTKMKFNPLKSNLSWSPEEAGRDGAGERALKNRLIKVQQS